MKKRKLFFTVLLTLSLALNGIAAVILMPDYAAVLTVKKPYSSLRITVKDAISGKTLEGATVCIPETNSYYKTNSDGLSGNIQIPYIENISHEQILTRGFGDITVLVYTKGYVDYLIFYIMTKPHSTRFLTISLYPSEYENDNALHTLIESPDNEWAKQIRDKYKK